jgi:hypothetical protein
MGGNIGGRQPTIADHARSLGWVRRRTTWYRERGIMAGEAGGRAVYKGEITRTLRTVTKRYTAASSVRAWAGLACAHTCDAWPARDGSEAIYIYGTSTATCTILNKLVVFERKYEVQSKFTAATWPTQTKCPHQPSLPALRHVAPTPMLWRALRECSDSPQGTAMPLEETRDASRQHMLRKCDREESSCTHGGGMVDIGTLCAVPSSNFPRRTRTGPNALPMCFQECGVLTPT